MQWRRSQFRSPAACYHYRARIEPSPPRHEAANETVSVHDSVGLQPVIAIASSLRMHAESLSYVASSTDLPGHECYCVLRTYVAPSSFRSVSMRARCVTRSHCSQPAATT